jgi:molybdenum cofactor cytidylyltransferase
VVVIGPPHGERVADEARRLGLELAENPDPDRGMSSSVAIGFQHALARFGDAAAALLWPVDHARVAVMTVARVLAEAGPGRAVIPTLRGRGGHPTAFGRALWPELAGCAELPRGARSVLDSVAGRVLRVEVDDPGVTADIDRAEDLL